MYDQWIGKSLPEALQAIDNETLVYIGAQSAFFDIAPAGEMRQEEYIETLSEKLKEIAEDRAETSKKRLFGALRNPPRWEGLTKQCEDEEESVDKYIGMMENWPARLKARRQAVVKTSYYAENFVPLWRRAVKSIYQSADGTGVCVIVTGNEIGGYWMLSEKESGKDMVENG